MQFIFSVLQGILIIIPLDIQKSLKSKLFGKINSELSIYIVKGEIFHILEVFNQ